MLTSNEREELEQIGAAAVRAKLAANSAGRRSLLDGFLQCSDPGRGDVEDWLAEQAKMEAADQRRMMQAMLRWAKIAAAASILGIVLIGWIAWRPESYIYVMDHIGAATGYAVDVARGGLWRR